MAAIQGRDCLIQKFRNSSVMLEHPLCRPKVSTADQDWKTVLLLTLCQLYVTGHGSNAGEEEDFPPPDNPSKMRRSVENAEHVGMITRKLVTHKLVRNTRNFHVPYHGKPKHSREYLVVQEGPVAPYRARMDYANAASGFSLQEPGSYPRTNTYTPPAPTPSRVRSARPSRRGALFPVGEISTPTRRPVGASLTNIQGWFEDYANAN